MVKLIGQSFALVQNQAPLEIFLFDY